MAGYISDQTEEEKNSRRYGDCQVLVADDEKDEEVDEEVDED